MLNSHAQNFEDVVLWRALKHVEHGFYIDIGAQDPVIDSVSLAFYEKGWRGVHAEPTPAYAAKLREARMDEDVIEAAIAQSPGPITLFEIADTGLSTGKNEIARMHAKSGFASKSIEVTALPLSELFARYPDREIHWLKIDVEGMEDEVIASWQPSTARPWVVVVESTVPLSQQSDYARWEPNLLSLGYVFVYLDGLNRFYVHRDHNQLLPAFGIGPNVFDEFTLTEQSHFTSKLNSEISGLRHELRTVTAQTQSHLAERDALMKHVSILEQHHQEKVDELHNLLAEIERVHSAERSLLVERASQAEQQAIVVDQLIRGSTSWRLTAPLRGLKRRAGSVAAWPRTKARYGLRHALVWLTGRPRASALAKSLLRFVPLEGRFEALLRAYSASTSDVDAWTLEPDREILNEWRKLFRHPRS
jgi:FkbM family methyltransferase